MKISVIIPVYGVEKFVGKCTKSLMEQTLNNGVEFIFVDDCTPDHSIEIIKETIAKYPERRKHCRIVRHEKNRGLPAARNTGLEHATGEYVLHFDGDDFAEPDMLETLLNQARESEADVVYSDWYLTYENTRRYMSQPECTTPMEAVEQMLKGKMKYNVWNKLVRRSLFDTIVFPEGYGMGEDMTMIRVMASASKISYLPKAFYNYVKVNSGAMTENIGDKAMLQIKHNVEETIGFLKAHCKNLPDSIFDVFKLNVKFPLLISDKTKDYKRWRKLWPESNKSIKSAGFSKRNQILNMSAATNLWPLVWLHYKAYHFAYTQRFNRHI